jgi:hypothetical protein
MRRGSFLTRSPSVLLRSTHPSFRLARLRTAGSALSRWSFAPVEPKRPAPSSLPCRFASTDIAASFLGGRFHVTGGFQSTASMTVVPTAFFARKLRERPPAEELRGIPPRRAFSPPGVCGFGADVARSASSRRMRRPSWPPCSVENRTQDLPLAKRFRRLLRLNHFAICSVFLNLNINDEAFSGRNT